MIGNSAVSARRNALVAAIVADTALSGVLQGEMVYIRTAPEGSPLPYIMLAQTIELDGGYLMQPGQEGVEDMTCWHIDLIGAQEVYELLYRALNKRKIPVVDHTMVRGSLSYVTDVEDKTREAWGVVARYRAKTVNT
jgi:uncharacterized membrane protein